MNAEYGTEADDTLAEEMLDAPVDAMIAQEAEFEEEEKEEEEEPAKVVADTGFYDDSIKLYLRDVQKTKLLTAEDERELATRIAQGDMAARNRMIESNLRLVIKIAKRYTNRGLPFMDLIEEGNLGLIKAVERFQISKECRFSTYATWWIRQTIERALVNQTRTIRLPVHVSDEINRMQRASRELTHQMNREPTVKEVATALGSTPVQVRRLKLLLKRTYSFEQPLGENGDYNLIDTIEDTSGMQVSELLEHLNKFELVTKWLEGLSENEQKILTLRFGLADKEPQTLDTIGRSFGVTRERIRQIEVKSLEKLRQYCRDLELPPVSPEEDELDEQLELTGEAV